jgi:hypothetical protein
MNKANVVVSRSPGGSLAIDIHKSQLPPAFEGRKLALSGPTVLESGEMVLMLTLRRKQKGLAPMFATNTRHITQRDRLITRFSVKRNTALMAQLPFGMTACELTANSTRMEITVPAPEDRTKAIYKNEYRALDPDRRPRTVQEIVEEATAVPESEDVALTPKTARDILCAAICRVNEHIGPDDRLFINPENGRLGVEFIARFGG